jgi:hypothetical protein
VVGHQARLPQFQEDPGSDPLLETVVGRRTRTEAGGIERLPLAAGAQDEEDGFHANAVGDAGTPAPKPMGVFVFGKEHLDGVPKVVGDAPLISSLGAFHVAASES